MRLNSTIILELIYCKVLIQLNLLFKVIFFSIRKKDRLNISKIDQVNSIHFVELFLKTTYKISSLKLNALFITFNERANINL